MIEDPRLLINRGSFLLGCDRQWRSNRIGQIVDRENTLPIISPRGEIMARWDPMEGPVKEGIDLGRARDPEEDHGSTGFH